VKIGFEIVPVEQGRGGALYSLRFEGEEKTERDKFLDNGEIQACKEFESLVVRLYDMVDSLGFRDNFFKLKKGSINDSVAAFHCNHGTLRLYCLRWSSILLIVGSGGSKTTRTYQGDPLLSDAVGKLQMVDKLFDERQKSREIIIDPNTGIITGNLVFTFD
jgi:hypothetical protein